MKRVAVFALGMLVWAASGAPARAVATHGKVWRATYVAAFTPTFGRERIPYSGTLRLKFDNGSVSGTYTGESIRVDPLYGRTVLVSGGTESGHIMLNFGSPGGFRVNARISEDGSISGTTTIHRRFYNFVAHIKSTP